MSATARRAPYGVGGRSLLFSYFNAMPKGNVIGKIFSDALNRALLRLRIVPNGVFVYLAIYHRIIVTRLAFPKTSRMMVAFGYF